MSKTKDVMRFVQYGQRGRLVSTDMIVANICRYGHRQIRSLYGGKGTEHLCLTTAILPYLLFVYSFGGDDGAAWKIGEPCSGAVGVCSKSLRDL